MRRTQHRPARETEEKRQLAYAVLLRIVEDFADFSSFVVYTLLIMADTRSSTNNCFIIITLRLWEIATRFTNSLHERNFRNSGDGL
jgi:hypothetical protein